MLYTIFVFLLLSPLSFIIYKFLIKKDKNLDKNEFFKKVIDLFVVIFLGALGVHKFVKRKYEIGVLYLLTLGIFGIGWLIDVVRSVRLLMNLGVGNSEILKKVIDLFISIFLGALMVCKFVEKKYEIGVLYFFTLGLLVIGWLFNIVKSMRALTDLNKKTEKILK